MGTGVAGLRALPCGPKRYPRKVFVGHGLYLMHCPNGSRYWRLKFYFGGKETHLSLGVFPFVSAEMAKARHLIARRLLAAGIDPRLRKETIRRIRLDSVPELEAA